MPLIFDLPFEQLPSYQGRNPRPQDFGTFWEQGLAEMRATDPQVELIPADFKVANAECFHLYFTGVGGARIHAKLLHPVKSPLPHPAVLLFHGYTGDSGDWSDKCCVPLQERKNMPLLNIVIALIVVGVALWMINRYIPMASSIKTILNVVVVVAVCVWVLQVAGLWGQISTFRLNH